jgi:transposase
VPNGGLKEIEREIPDLRATLLGKRGFSVRHDCTQASALIEGLSAEHLLADRGYDSDSIVEQATKQGMQVVIPACKNRKEPREYDDALYRHRHLVENAFLQLKRWRGIATRYAKNAASFLAAAQIRCIAIWARIL